MQLQRVHQERHLIAVAVCVLAGCADPPRATAVALGGAHTCALDEDGAVWCWGGSGALEPEIIADLPIVTSLSAGDGHTCAVGADESVWCWGAGDRGQIGDGRLEASPTPSRVAGVDDAVQIAAGDHHTCVVHRDETVSCWGDNSTGQLGSPPSDEPVPLPRAVPDVQATRLGAGGIDGVSRTCAITAGEVRCWGRLTAVTAVPELGRALAVDVGADHVCAVDDRGALRCVGTFPEAALTGLESASFRDVSAGALHSCALSRTSEVWCFGDDLEGQLGDGAADASGDAVRAVASSAVAVGVGSLHSCAVLDGGQVQCWGENNNGRLGTGAAGGVETSPVRVVGFGE